MCARPPARPWSHNCARPQGLVGGWGWGGVGAGGSILLLLLLVLELAAFPLAKSGVGARGLGGAEAVGVPRVAER